jgi:D-psicose/D-tagatose/L-ribulose 3-epimerase
MNLLLWGSEINESLFPVLEEIKMIGYDAVEIPLFDTDEKQWKQWKNKLDELQLGAVAVTINGPDYHAISKDATMRKKTLERNKLALNCASILGAELLTGPFHSALGVFTGTKSTSEEQDWAVEHLYQLSEHASKLNITLGLEYLNRFESYLVSCADELISLVKKVNHPHCKMMLDTFHANIEEKNIVAAIGQGHIDFAAIIRALDQINYTGMISVEAFSMKLSAANIWREMFTNEMQLTKDSFQYLKSL